LTLGRNFDQSFARVTLPPHLQSLTVGGNLDLSFDGLTLPSGLQSLTRREFDFLYYHKLDRVTVPTGLQELCWEGLLVSARH
jgi:hypothetical protein